MAEETSFITEDEKTKKTKKDDDKHKSFPWKNILIIGRFFLSFFIFI